jgi:hypothetical protein
MPPSPILDVSSQLRTQIAKHLRTNYEGLKSFADARALIPNQLQRWAKVRRAEGGDTMHARNRVTPQADSRDATYIKVCLIDAIPRLEQLLTVLGVEVLP